MQHADVLRRNDMHEVRRLHMPNLDEARLERENVRREDGESVGVAFPGDHPVGPSTPAIAVNKERVV